MIRDAFEFAGAAIIVGIGASIALASGMAIIVGMFFGVMWALS